jgi:hypothetical protein
VLTDELFCTLQELRGVEKVAGTELVGVLPLISVLVGLREQPFNDARHLVKILTHCDQILKADLLFNIDHSTGFLMTQQIRKIGSADCVARLLPIGLVIFIGMQTAEAKQCSAALPSNPQGHWSYRLIDGRKCWYEGENNFPKSLLQWPEQTSALSAFGKAEPRPDEEPLPPVKQTGANSEGPVLKDFDTFEARWRGLVH